MMGRRIAWAAIFTFLVSCSFACSPGKDEGREAARTEESDDHVDGEADGSHDDHDHEAAVSHDEHEHEVAGESHGDHDGEDEQHAGGSHSDAGHEDHEGLRVVLSQAAIAGGGIELSPAGPRTMHIGIDLPGEVVLNADRLAHVVPRFPGIAREVKKALGDHVSADEVLAIIESNESLARYEVRSMISGTVTEKHITLGEFVRDDEDVFVVADLSTVWVNITVYARDIDRVRKGQTVEISVVGGGQRATATIDYIAPSLGEESRAATARAVIRNPNLEWRQGMFVSARVVLEEPTVPVAVLDSAIQRLEGREAVFVQEGEGAFEGRFVTLGRSDGEWTEILSGLSAGEPYVSAESFLLKSELMKSEASHEH